MADEIRQFVVGAIQTNCYAYVSEGECMVVDPGASGAAIAEHLKDVYVGLVVATHGHHDHVCGVKALVEACGAPWAIGEPDAERSQQALERSSHASPSELWVDDPPAPDKLLKEGDVLNVGTATFTAYEAPGHTKGGIVLLGGSSAEGVCFVGDTLFKGSCGRTDLAGGDHDELMRTLARLRDVIPPQTTLLCGHGEATTMAYELATNPWLQVGPHESDGMH